MWTTNNCCGCFSLRTGCLIIGWIQFIFPALDFILTVTGVGNTTGSSTTGDSSFWGEVVNDVFQIIVSGCLLYGVYKHRRAFVRFYVYVECVLLVIRVMVLLIIAITGGYASLAVAIISALIIIVFFLYLIAVVYSYYLEMETVTVY